MAQRRGRWSRRHRGVVTGALLAVLVMTAGVAGARPAGADPVAPGYRPPVVPSDPAPPQPDHLAASRYLKDHPNAVPAGVNDFGCRPTPEHPHPVVLAHGTDASVYTDWAAIAPALVRAGFCVFAVNYGGAPDAVDSFGTEDLWLAADQMGEFVDTVRTATRSDRVDLVGFSQGANVTRYYVDKLGGAAAVGRWVGLASPTYGGIMYGLVPLAEAIPALWGVYEQVTSHAAVQQAEGSPFIDALNAGGDTVPGVQYTTVASRVDEMIQPFTNMALRGPGARNIVLQDLCPDDLTGHFHLVYDPMVQQLVIDILDPDHARPPECQVVPLGTGIPEVILGAHS